MLPNGMRDGLQHALPAIPLLSRYARRKYPALFPMVERRRQLRWHGMTQILSLCGRKLRRAMLASHFQPVARARHKGVERGHQKDADQKTCEKAADNDQGEWPL